MAAEEIDPIDFPNLGRLGVGRQSKSLYLDDKKIQTEASVRLTDRQARWAGAAAIGALVGGLSTLVYTGAWIYDSFWRTKPIVSVGRAPLEPSPNGGPLPSAMLPKASTEKAPSTPSPAHSPP
jgi:hypothetical protein